MRTGTHRVTLGHVATPGAGQDRCYRDATTILLGCHSVTRHAFVVSIPSSASTGPDLILRFHVRFFPDVVSPSLNLSSVPFGSGVVAAYVLVSSEVSVDRIVLNPWFGTLLATNLTIGPGPVGVVVPFFLRRAGFSGAEDREAP